MRPTTILLIVLGLFTAIALADRSTDQYLASYYEQTQSDEPAPKKTQSTTCMCTLPPQLVPDEPPLIPADIVLAIDQSACFKNLHARMQRWMLKLIRYFHNHPKLKFGVPGVRISLMQFSDEIMLPIYFSDFGANQTNKELHRELKTAIENLGFIGQGAYLDTALDFSKQVLVAEQDEDRVQIVIMLTNGNSHPETTYDMVERSILGLNDKNIMLIPVAVTEKCDTPDVESLCPNDPIMSRLARVGRQSNSQYFNMKDEDAIVLIAREIIAKRTPYVPPVIVEPCDIRNCTCEIATEPGPPGLDGLRGESIAGQPGFRGLPGYPGLDGSKGDEGEKGFMGFRGLKGEPGYEGFAGVRGEEGLQGDTGPEGLQGYRGLPGYPGFPGEEGEEGPEGPEGMAGARGQKGRRGRRGKLGKCGTRGDRGPRGDPGRDIVGLQGSKGQSGVPGRDGRPGRDGYNGRAGRPGVDGMCGEEGPEGPPGYPGYTGSNGRVGLEGPMGPQGPQGFPGQPGEAGECGFPGLPGMTGPPGEKGERGEKGREGNRGSKGEAGEPSSLAGLPGHPGCRGIAGIPGEEGKHGQNGRRGPPGPMGQKGVPGEDDYISFEEFRPQIRDLIKQMLAASSCSGRRL